jgi:hypothetical protein
MIEKGNAQDATKAGVILQAAVGEQIDAPSFHFDFSCVGPAESDRANRIALLERIASLTGPRPTWRKPLALVRHLLSRGDVRRVFTLRDLRAELELIPLFPQWADAVHNTVTTPGKNDILDKYFAGSGYTAAWYLGLISSVSYSAIAAADTMSSHAGWTEAGATNAPNYSSPAARGTMAFSAASGGSKALSAALAYTMSGAGTLKGAFATTVSTKDGTTGILYSAGLFSGGDRTVASSDVVNVSGSWSV